MFIGRRKIMDYTLQLGLKTHTYLFCLRTCGFMIRLFWRTLRERWHMPQYR